MSTGLPKRFDPARLAEQEKTLAGEIGTGDLPRLQAVLVGDSPVKFDLRAVRDEAKRLVIEGQVDADLVCTCQRCMQPVTLATRSDFLLAVVADEDSAGRLPAELEPVMPDDDGEIDLVAMLEDELLLALPVIAMHANPDDCGEYARLGRETGEEKKEFDAAAKRENPFAVLKKLKQDNTD